MIDDRLSLRTVRRVGFFLVAIAIGLLWRQLLSDDVVQVESLASGSSPPQPQSTQSHSPDSPGQKFETLESDLIVYRKVERASRTQSKKESSDPELSEPEPPKESPKTHSKTSTSSQGSSSTRVGGQGHNDESYTLTPNRRYDVEEALKVPGLEVYVFKEKEVGGAFTDGGFEKRSKNYLEAAINTEGITRTVLSSLDGRRRRMVEEEIGWEDGLAPYAVFTGQSLQELHRQVVEISGSMGRRWRDAESAVFSIENGSIEVTDVRF